MSFHNEITFEKAAKAGRIEGVHSRFENAYADVLETAGRSYPNVIGGKERVAAQEFEDRCPSDSSVIVGRFQKGTREDVNDAVLVAERAFLDWSRIDYRERLKLFERASVVMRREKFHLAAAITLDNGKNRYEAMADVDESIDFIEFYRWQMEKYEGFTREMRSPYPEEKVESVLRPYGVWAVICPFNFPAAITTGMATGALIAGNTVVLKPSSPVPLPVYLVYDIFKRAGLPDGVLNFVAGPGTEVGEALINHKKIGGVVFTGSKEIGYGIIRQTGRDYPIPVIAEMGGKNPIIVTSKANVEDAVSGVVSSAFGFGGQKCSACSRVYVQSSIYDDFKGKILERTKELSIGDPSKREVFMGPVVTEKAADDFERYVGMAKKDGRILVGGSRLVEGALGRGHYVSPTIVEDLPRDHYLIKNELFVPILCLQRTDDLKEALREANDVEFGLTAGIFSRDKDEVEYFFNNIEAGVIYANRMRGGSTGAMVGGQAFGGWKASGSSGKGAGGAYYLLQFMREQSRTRL